MRRPLWQHLFEAHMAHGVQPGAPYVTAADLAELRKLKQLQAVLYAEGYDNDVYGHVVDGMLSGRIEP